MVPGKNLPKKLFLLVVCFAIFCVGLAVFVFTRGDHGIPNIADSGHDEKLNAKIPVKSVEYDHKQFAWSQRLKDDDSPQDFDLFTAPSVHRYNGQLEIKNYEMCAIDDTLPLYLSDISPRPYRIRIEGYTRPFNDDDDDVVMLRDVENDKSGECVVGKRNDDLKLTLKSFKVEEHERNGVCYREPTAVIYDEVLGGEFELTNKEKFLNEKYNVTVKDMKGNDYVMRNIGDCVAIGDATCTLEAVDAPAMTAKLLLVDDHGQKFHKTIHVAR